MSEAPSDLRIAEFVPPEEYEFRLMNKRLERSKHKGLGDGPKRFWEHLLKTARGTLHQEFTLDFDREAFELGREADTLRYKWLPKLEEIGLVYDVCNAGTMKVRCKLAEPADILPQEEPWPLRVTGWKPNHKVSPEQISIAWQGKPIVIHFAGPGESFQTARQTAESFQTARQTEEPSTAALSMGPAGQERSATAAPCTVYSEEEKRLRGLFSSSSVHSGPRVVAKQHLKDAILQRAPGLHEWAAGETARLICDYELIGNHVVDLLLTVAKMPEGPIRNGSFVHGIKALVDQELPETVQTKLRSKRKTASDGEGILVDTHNSSAAEGTNPAEPPKSSDDYKGMAPDVRRALEKYLDEKPT